MRRGAVLALLGLAAAGALVVAPQLGSAGPWWPGSSDEALRTIFWRIRVPRVLLGFLAGGSLAVAGVILQALLRNPLASPFTLGVSGGAALGAVLALYLGLETTIGPFSSLTVAAFGGAAATLAAVWGFGRPRGLLESGTLLLAGVTVHFFAGALIMLFQYLLRTHELQRVVHWMMGDLTTMDYGAVLQLAPPALLGLAAAAWLWAGLDLVSTGEELAAARGLQVRRLYLAAFLVASLLAGSTVALAGPIGFVGLIVPHALRRLVGPGHALLVPCSFVGGGTFLVACDALSRVVLRGAELPIGVVTALLGGPFFLFLLLRRGARPVW